MKHFFKHLKLIAFFIVVLMSFQSCVVYHSTPITVEELSEIRNGKVKIYTVDGSIYKADSIAIIEGNIECLRKTKEITIDTSSIRRITIMESQPLDVNIISALHHDGITQIEANGQTYNFIKITELGDKIVGVTSSKVNQVAFVIQKEQIEKVKIQNTYTSKVGNIFIGIGISVAVIAGIIGIAYSGP